MSQNPATDEVSLQTSSKTTILDDWDITAEELTEVLASNPSLRGMILGYVAEFQLKKQLARNKSIAYGTKFDDHDRKKKGDMHVIYKDVAFDIEAKSLQTNTVKQTENGWTGKAQVDASDRRIVKLPNGEELNTTLLLRGEFDILAINCYAFNSKWEFLFAANKDLPGSSFKGYTEYQQKNLIASLIKVDYPAESPFTPDITKVMDRLIHDGHDKQPAKF